jgi:retron-type reverse transcriptase
MKWLTISKQQKSELDFINSTHPTQKCEPVVTSDGVIVTSSDKLSDEYWVDWHNWLKTLSPFIGTPSWITNDE